VSSKAARAPALEALPSEPRRLSLDAGLAARASATAALYAEADADHEAFWARLARERLTWSTPFGVTLEWDLPFAQWFVGGELNVAYNCVDRHVERGLGDKVAYHWIGEPGDTRTLTYRDLQGEVNRAANALLELGVRRGDRVAIYLPMVPELPIAMLACARIGAAHTVVFSGFSAEALAERINDARATVLVTADGGWRRGRRVGLKHHADEAVASTPSIRHVVVVGRLGDGAHMVDGRDHWWGELVGRQLDRCDPVPVDSEQVLFLLYTSGTTARPKGIVHTSAGYLLGCSFTHATVFDLRPDDVYWCPADVGSITGHSYVVYGPLANAATGILYEGAPDTPDWDRWWQIVEEHRVTILYTAPSAIRAFMRQGEAHPRRHDLGSIRLLGSGGESMTPEAWRWYHEHVGGGRAPIVDTWWQTETGSIMISPLPGVTVAKPGSVAQPLPGIGAEIVDGSGNPVARGGGGYLVLTRPWPSMLRGIHGDEERYWQVYWSRFPGRYLTGDGAKRDEDGDVWLLGRVDDVINVAGHRLSTIEVESALADHPAVAEAAVVGRTEDVVGQAVFAFVMLEAGHAPSDALALQLREHVAYAIGPIARPAYLLFTPHLPRTRSGAIMRRLLREIAEGRSPGDTSSLSDAGVVDLIREHAGRAED
jgi:acetyl-CoA synthetase